MKKKRIVEYLLLLSSIMTVNFMAYFSYYDINALSLVDSSTVAKHIFHIIILYTIISALVYIFFTILKMEVYLKNYANSFVKDKFVSIVFIIRHIISVLVFLMFYVSFLNLSVIIIILMLFIIPKIYSIRMRNKKDKNTDEFFDDKKELSIISFIFMLVNPAALGVAIFLMVKYLADESNIFFDISKTKNIFKIFATDFGILLLLLSLLSGIARANYVERSIFVNINKEKEVLVLYMSTNNGIGLYSRKLKEVSFSSWDSIKKLVFLKNEK